MLSRIRSATVLGVEALGIDVEIANGVPTFTTVGLPLIAVKEGRERVAAVIQSSASEASWPRSLKPGLSKGLSRLH